MVEFDITTEGFSELKKKIESFEKGVRRLSTGAAIGEMASNAARGRLRSKNKENALASWAPLSEEYAKRAGKGSILFRTKNMYNSTGYSLLQWASQGRVVLYSTAEYAKYHQFGKGRMHRPFLGLTVKDKKGIADALDKVIMGGLQ